MTRRKRTYYNAEQRAIIWDRYQKGDSLNDISRIFDRFHSSIQRIVGETGGIKPPIKRRSTVTLTLEEREEISRDLSSELSIREIARKLCRSASTISREVNRNGGRKLYRAAKADAAAWERAKRPKSCKLKLN
jgi:transposase